MSDISMLHLVMLLLYCQNKCQGKCFSEQYVMKDSFQNTTITELSIPSISGNRSKLECSVLCSENEECVSFFYNTRSGQCTGHSVQFYSTEPGSPDEGSVYYTKPIDKRDCADILEQNPDSPDGVYTINPLDGERHFRVYCDMTTEDGGWTVFQRRQDGSEDFLRNWNDYKNGFGTLNREFWLGNDNIHRLTTSGDVRLKITLGNHDGESRYSIHTSFKVDNESSNYRLTVSGYSGNAGDSFGYHNGFEFTTKDHDNDIREDHNCAVLFTGAWWYESCHEANLNGKYGDNSFGKGINWYRWTGINYSLKWTEMKIKPN